MDWLSFRGLAEGFGGGWSRKEVDKDGQSLEVGK
jgi:hypothetical protein